MRESTYVYVWLIKLHQRELEGAATDQLRYGCKEAAKIKMMAASHNMTLNLKTGVITKALKNLCARVLFLMIFLRQLGTSTDVWLNALGNQLLPCQA